MRPAITAVLAVLSLSLSLAASEAPNEFEPLEVTAVQVALDPADVASVDAGIREERRLRVGVVKEAQLAVDLTSLSPGDLSSRARPLPFGQIRRGTGDGFLYEASIESSGAVGMRLRFTGFYLPRNAELTLSNPFGESFTYAGRGPAGDGEFWSHTLSGSSVTLRIVYTGSDTARVLKAVRFVVADVGPLTDRFPGAREAAGNQLCSSNAPCVVNAECVSVPDKIKPAQDAVAMILFVSGAFQYICSGGLVADTDPGSAIPYFLTANHCLSRAREASSVEAYFKYMTSCNSCNKSLTTLPRALGSSILSTNKSSDYTLLRLSAAPVGTAFLPWNNSPVAFSNGATLYRISHPGGSPQAFSSHTVDTSKPTCSSWPRGNWIYSKDVSGATEGGSSGSPVLNAAGQIVGQLSGGCGYNVNDNCDADSNATVDGALAAYFSSVAQYLNPATSCTDADNDGYCSQATGGGDCNDAIAAINPGAIEVCGDGVDNNCNGLVDASDPACQTGTCELGAKGEPCSSGTECCSGSCKGKPGAMTCK